MKKIFNLSLHRSGTQSFARFCEEEGYAVQHWPGFKFDKMCEPALSTLDTCFVWDIYRHNVNTKDVFADVPMPFIYRHAFESYPNSKFVLVTRPVNAWIYSVRKHTHGRELMVMEKIQYWSISEVKRDRLSDYNDTELEIIYRTHIINVINFMNHRDGNLLVVKINDPEIGDKLGKFLGFKNKNLEFKNVDATKS